MKFLIFSVIILSFVKHGYACSLDASVVQSEEVNMILSNDEVKGMIESTGQSLFDNLYYNAEAGNYAVSANKCGFHVKPIWESGPDVDGIPSCPTLTRLEIEDSLICQ